MKFSVFMMRDGNYNLGGWRLPEAYPDAGENFARWIEYAGILERGKIDMLFIADSISSHGVDHVESMSHTARSTGFEPLTLLSALSMVTKRLGLAATAATTWNEPYTIARMFASLDHISGGRAAWNLVTGRNAEDANNYSREEHVARGRRYARAEEFIDIVRGLWDSYEDDAFLCDKATGQFFDPSKLHFLNYKSANFSVRGPLSVARPPQGHPVVVQAGESEPARELSARVADVVFTAQSSLASAKTFYADVKGRLARFGRSPDSLKILPGVSIYLGRTDEEAQEKFERLEALTPPAYAIRQLSVFLGGVDLSSYSPDGPMPQVQENVTRANPDRWLAFAHEKNLTLLQTAQRAAAAKAHWIVKGSPRTVADQLEEWFTREAADGFNLLPPYVPGVLNEFVELVLPELRRRGLFRTEYEGTTLRQNLGLPRPQNVFGNKQAKLHAIG